jgi:hypothetical protein
LVNKDATALTIHLAYPSTIKPLKTESACDILAAKNADGTDVSNQFDKTDCAQQTGSRLFKIKNAIPYGYDESITIVIGFKNPENNWGDIGFKLSTYEIVPGVDGAKDEQFLVDTLEGN